VGGGWGRKLKLSKWIETAKDTEKSTRVAATVGQGSRRSAAASANGSTKNDVDISAARRANAECTRWEDEGLEKATKWGVNESQSKFLAGTWHISQIEPDALLF
jgi:hypothetical protein